MFCESRRMVISKKIVSSSKFCVIHNAVDREKYKYSVQKREEIRGSMGITDQFVIGHVGNFCYQKNHYFLLDVFEEVHKKIPTQFCFLQETESDLKKSDK